MMAEKALPDAKGIETPMPAPRAQEKNTSEKALPDAKGIETEDLGEPDRHCGMP